MSIPYDQLSTYARSVVDSLHMEPHPEGGWYVRDWQSPINTPAESLALMHAAAHPDAGQNQSALKTALREAHEEIANGQAEAKIRAYTMKTMAAGKDAAANTDADAITDTTADNDTTANNATDTSAIDTFDNDNHDTQGVDTAFDAAAARLTDTTFADAADGRPLASMIYFLLPAGDVSAWHQVDADEIWLWHGPEPVQLQLGGKGAQPEPGEILTLGEHAQEFDEDQPDAASETFDISMLDETGNTANADVMSASDELSVEMGEVDFPMYSATFVGHVTVPAGTWQRTLPSTGDALVSCMVSPGFTFEGFKLFEPPQATPLSESLFDKGSSAPRA